MEGRDESDQLPEEQPSEAVPDDEGDGGDARTDATENPGGADSGDSDPEEATGGGAGTDA